MGIAMIAKMLNDATDEMLNRLRFDLAFKTNNLRLISVFYKRLSFTASFGDVTTPSVEKLGVTCKRSNITMKLHNPRIHMSVLLHSFQSPASLLRRDLRRSSRQRTYTGNASFIHSVFLHLQPARRKHSLLWSSFSFLFFFTMKDASKQRCEGSSIHLGNPVNTRVKRKRRVSRLLLNSTDRQQRYCVMCAFSNPGSRNRMAFASRVLLKTMSPETQLPAHRKSRHTHPRDPQTRATKLLLLLIRPTGTEPGKPRALKPSFQPTGKVVILIPETRRPARAPLTLPLILLVSLRTPFVEPVVQRSAGVSHSAESREPAIQGTRVQSVAICCVEWITQPGTVASESAESVASAT
ncbi:unnamed protein product [Notodromas monacha]|uniref:Uncharacterized protein n=1 Tax=Notodromas monacha TaxID=399045 RepID=A0A7R9BRI6_9CRUS|nr:unnamed protein product [Notodromas monacha]CAG0918979.1 unnamed protein product [Notodromas monacha]